MSNSKGGPCRASGTRPMAVMAAKEGVRCAPRRRRAKSRFESTVMSDPLDDPPQRRSRADACRGIRGRRPVLGLFLSFPARDIASHCGIEVDLHAALSADDE